VTPFRGINEAPFLIRVKDSSKLDFERISGKVRILFRGRSTNRYGKLSYGNFNRTITSRVPECTIHAAQSDDLHICTAK